MTKACLLYFFRDKGEGSSPLFRRANLLKRICLALTRVWEPSPHLIIFIVVPRAAAAHRARGDLLLPPPPPLLWPWSHPPQPCPATSSVARSSGVIAAYAKPPSLLSPPDLPATLDSFLSPPKMEKEGRNM